MLQITLQIFKLLDQYTRVIMENLPCWCEPYTCDVSIEQRCADFLLKMLDPLARSGQAHVGATGPTSETVRLRDVYKDSNIVHVELHTGPHLVLLPVSLVD